MPAKGVLKRFFTVGIGAVLGLGADFLGRLSFLQPPPSLEYHASDGSFWTGLATVCCGVVGAVIWAVLPTKKTTAKKLRVWFGIVTLVFLSGFVFVSLRYVDCRAKWTFEYRGEVVLIGDEYTEAASKDLQASPNNTKPPRELLADFLQRSNLVWTIDGHERRREALGKLYILCAMCGAICLSLIGWLILRLTPG